MDGQSSSMFREKPVFDYFKDLLSERFNLRAIVGPKPLVSRRRKSDSFAIDTRGTSKYPSYSVQRSAVRCTWEAVLPSRL